MAAGAIKQNNKGGATEFKLNSTGGALQATTSAVDFRSLQSPPPVNAYASGGLAQLNIDQLHQPVASLAGRRKLTRQIQQPNTQTIVRKKKILSSGSWCIESNFFDFFQSFRCAHAIKILSMR